MEPTSTMGPKLSICIATFNRAKFIGATLASIISQATDECEIVVSDNASTDETQRVVEDCARTFSRLRYIRHQTNRGLDWNFDTVVEHAQGEYCWLMPDDDLLKPGAIACVMQALRSSPSLVVTDIEFKDYSVSRVVKSRSLEFSADRSYAHHEADRLFVDVNKTFLYIGNIIIKRTVWLERERAKFYGSLFIHVAVIFQKPLPGETRVIASPLISYRQGNAPQHSSTTPELLLAKWPAIVAATAISPRARRKVKSAEPWRNPDWLLLLRARGLYSTLEYQRWVRIQCTSLPLRTVSLLVALLPAGVVNALFVSYYFLRRNVEAMQALKDSPPSFWKPSHHNT